jgi:hypothetical protein
MTPHIAITSRRDGFTFTACRRARVDEHAISANAVLHLDKAALRAWGICPDCVTSLRTARVTAIPWHLKPADDQPRTKRQRRRVVPNPSEM